MIGVAEATGLGFVCFVVIEFHSLSNYQSLIPQIVIRDVFRRYPNKYETVIATLCEHLDSLDEPEAKGAMVRGGGG